MYTEKPPNVTACHCYLNVMQLNVSIGIRCKKKKGMEKCSRFCFFILRFILNAVRKNICECHNNPKCWWVELLEGVKSLIAGATMQCGKLHYCSHGSLLSGPWTEHQVSESIPCLCPGTPAAEAALVI